MQHARSKALHSKQFHNGEIPNTPRKWAHKPPVKGVWVLEKPARELPIQMENEAPTSFSGLSIT